MTKTKDKQFSYHHIPVQNNNSTNPEIKSR